MLFAKLRELTLATKEIDRNRRKELFTVLGSKNMIMN